MELFQELSLNKDSKGIEKFMENIWDNPDFVLKMNCFTYLLFLKICLRLCEEFHLIFSVDAHDGSRD